LAYKILYAEDDPLSREKYGDYLTQAGAEVITAKNGQEALELLKNEKFDLLLTGLTMPVIDGMELISRSRKSSPDLPVVILSGGGTVSEAVEAVNLHVFQYLVKPLKDLEVLKNTVFEAIEHNSTMQCSLFRQVLKDVYFIPRIGPLTVGMAHNIKSPLTGVMGYSQLLKMKNPDIEGLDVIIEQANIVSGLLSMVGDKGQSEINFAKTPIDLFELIKIELKFLDFNLFFRHQVDTKIIELKAVPSFPGIYHQIAKVFHHLMQNAADAVFETQKKQISIVTDSFDDTVRLIITDTGVGISPKDLVRVFEPGFSTKPLPYDVEDYETPHGYGLGLYFVKEILNDYNAEIEIESEVGVGTKVTVEFPI